MGNWKNCLVCLFTPTVGDGEGVYGTAVPIRPGILLTALHVVRPLAAQRDFDQRILVRWRYSQDPGFEDFIKLSPDNEAILWCSEALDVALIACPQPTDAAQLGMCSLCQEKPKDGTEWFSDGFPTVAVDDEERQAFSFGGKVYSKAEAEPTFEVTCDKAPEDVDDWGGASGMPVMVGGKILGVVLQVPHGFAGGVLQATPVWKLLEDPTFVAKIHDPEDDLVREAALGRIKKALAAEKRLFEILKDHFDGELKTAAGNQDAAGTAEKLLELDMRTALKGLHAAWKDQHGLQKAIQILAADVAAALCPAEAVKALRSNVRYNGKGMVEVPVGTLTSAEFVVASTAGKQVRLRKRRSDGDYPSGQHWIPLAPECGEDDGEAAAAAVCEHIEYRALADFGEGLDDLLTRTEDLGGFYAPITGRPVPDLAGKKEIVKDRLEDEAEFGERSPYLAFFAPKNPEQRVYLNTVVETIRSYYKPIVALALDPDISNEERRALTGLRLMHPLED